MPRTPPDMQTGGAPSTGKGTDNATPHKQPLGPVGPSQEGGPSQDGATPRLPHERDQSSETQGSAPQPEASQAKKDIDRGLVDTSRARETDEAYRKQKPPGG